MEIIKESMEGEILIGIIGKGGIFREMAMVDNEPPMAAARAKYKTTVLTIDLEMFTKRLSDGNPFVRGPPRIFCKNIRSTMALRLEN